MHPESLMMTYGYAPSAHHGAVKSPLYQSSTFAFASAEEGKAYFELAYGLREAAPNETMGMIYSRLDNPTLSLLEKRLALYEQAEEGAVFASGMAAISTTLLAFLKPGDLLLHSSPVYGGTDHFLAHVLPTLGIETMTFSPEDTEEDLLAKVQATGKADKLAMIYLETPANPTNHLFDIALAARVTALLRTEEKKVCVAVDNTYMGPLWQKPLQHGADLVVYSATKYLSGHSDVIAGAVLGAKAWMQPIKTLRTFLGNMGNPHDCWLLLRSLETLKVRMDRQLETAKQVADYLAQHPAVAHVHYLGLLPEGSPAAQVYARQCLAPGAMLSFELHGGEAEAFAFLNSLHLVKLAVSLGSTESLAQHPRSMTHAGVAPETCEKMGISAALVRLSVGVEHPADLIADLAQALAHVSCEEMAVR